MGGNCERCRLVLICVLDWDVTISQKIFIITKQFIINFLVKLQRKLTSLRIFIPSTSYMWCGSFEACAMLFNQVWIREWLPMTIIKKLGWPFLEYLCFLPYHGDHWVFVSSGMKKPNTDVHLWLSQFSPNRVNKTWWCQFMDIDIYYE